MTRNIYGGCKPRPWNHRDAAALGRLFTADGVLDMATKHQDTLHKHEWASTGGLAARRLIAALAERQWRLGEKLSYRGVSVVVRANGGPEADGGGAVVVARFADGTVQPMEETKFAYDCPLRLVSCCHHLGQGGGACLAAVKAAQARADPREIAHSQGP